MSDHGTESLRNLGINRFPVVVLYLKLAGLPNVAVVMAASLQSGLFFQISNFLTDIYPNGMIVKNQIIKVNVYLINKTTVCCSKELIISLSIILLTL